MVLRYHRLPENITFVIQHIHYGRNNTPGKKYKTLSGNAGTEAGRISYELGDDWNQKKVSMLESKEVVDEVLLEQVAKVLKVPKAAITNLTDEGAVNIFSNTFTSNDTSIGCIANQYNFNPLDEWKENVLENKKLQEENKSLYERLLQVEREKNELLLQMLAEKGK